MLQDSTNMTSSQPTDESYTHVGWVPCLSGHLDFALTQPQLSGKFTGYHRDKNTTCINYSPTGLEAYHVRNVALQSWVDWNDTHDEEYSRSRVCLIATANEASSPDDRELSGHIIIYPKEYEGPRCNHKANMLDAMHSLASIMNTKWTPSSSQSKWLNLKNWVKKVLTHNDHPKKEPPREPFQDEEEYLAERNQAWDNLLKTIPEPADEIDPIRPEKSVLGDEIDGAKPNIYRIDFKVKANGLTYIKFHDLNIHKVTKHGRSNEIDQDDKYVLCRQAFYYLKYSLHQHKHHDKDQDAMTTIVKRDKDAGLRMIGQIKRELMRTKRLLKGSYQQEQSAKALGIVAYAKSLCIALKRAPSGEPDRYEIQLAHFESIQESFQSSMSHLIEKSRQENDREGSLRFILTLFAAAMTLFFILTINLMDITASISAPSAIENQIKQGDIGFHTFGMIAFSPLLIYGTIHLLNQSKSWIPMWRFFYDRVPTLWMFLGCSVVSLTSLLAYFLKALGQ